MLKKGLFALAASSLLATAALAGGPEGMTFEELKATCLQFESNAQILPFESTFTCSESHLEWVKVGSAPILLGNDRGMVIEANVKSGTHVMGALAIPLPAAAQATSCDQLDQIETVVRRTVVVNSCAALVNAGTEAEFCRAILAPEWASCGETSKSHYKLKVKVKDHHHHRSVRIHEHIPIGVAEAPVLEPVPGGVCEVRATGATKGCTASGPAVVGVAAPVTTTTSSSAVAVAPMVGGEVILADLGTRVEFKKVKKGHKHHYPVLVLMQDPTQGSLLAGLGLKAGDHIAKINNKHILSDRELHKVLKAAKSKKEKIRIKHAGKDMKFVEREKSL